MFATRIVCYDEISNYYVEGETVGTAEEIVNRISGEKIARPEPVDEEVVFGGGVMITETDLTGVITYANRKFCEMTGFSREELIGTPHSLIRHPDMPDGIFRSMWKTIRKRKIWRGYIKNIRKDGRYYWVLVYVQPKVDEKGELVGYIAGRKEAYPEEVEKIVEVYDRCRREGVFDEELLECNYDEMLKSGSKLDTPVKPAREEE